MQLKLANEYGGVKEAQLTKTTKVSMHRAAHTYYAARHSCVAGAAAAHSGGGAQRRDNRVFAEEDATAI